MDPVWQSDEWKEARKRLLAGRCQQCGSDQKLALVHLWKPPRYAIIKNSIENQKIEELIHKREIEEFVPGEGIDKVRKSCPNCSSINLRERKVKRPRFHCGKCSHEFDHGKDIMVRDDYLFRQTYSKWKKDHLKDFQLEIDKEIEKCQEEYNKKYRSGEGTTTFCKKCSFLWTQKGMQLCNKCGNNYHKRRYEQCYTCFQKDKNRTMIICEKCRENEIEPQPGDLQICEQCYEKMWDELTK